MVVAFHYQPRSNHADEKVVDNELPRPSTRATLSISIKDYPKTYDKVMSDSRGKKFLSTHQKFMPSRVLNYFAMQI